MITRIQLRRDSASNWTVNNPVLALGEFGIDTDTFNFKIGNGVDSWNNLNYFSVEVDDVISQTQLDDAVDPLSDRLDIIEGDASTEGSIAKAEADAKSYADAEIEAAKLALGTNYSVEDIAARDALQNLTVGDIVFVADDNDGKWAQYKVTEIDPVVFLKIMDQDIFLNALSAPDVKAAYESNADTNAFTDSLKNKLEATDIFDNTGTYSELRARGTTAQDVGLENVDNYQTATQSEAEEGTASDKFMTPERTAQAIATQVSSQLSTGSYLTQTDFDNQIGNFGGTGIIWDSGEENYDLDFASLAEVETGTETDKVISPFTASALVIDGGEFN